MYKLERLNFPLQLTKITQSFLNGRTFSVKIGDFITTTEHMRAGTPQGQGSVISPLLFNLYLFEIPTSKLVNTLQLADDTSPYCTGGAAQTVQDGLNIFLQSLSNYFGTWKLKLIEAKSSLVVIMGFVKETNSRLRRRFRHMKICMNGHTLKHDTGVKLLGIVCSRNNRLVRHIDHVLKKARRASFALSPLIRSRLIEPRIRTNMYKCYIRPVLTYASAIWAKPICLSSHQMEPQNRQVHGGGVRSFLRELRRFATTQAHGPHPTRIGWNIS